MVKSLFLSESIAAPKVYFMIVQLNLYILAEPFHILPLIDITPLHLTTNRNYLLLQ